MELMVESLMVDRSVDHYDYIRHLFRVVLSMSKLGGVILVGRAGNFILGPRCGYHIRCISPKENRIDNLVRYGAYRLSEASELITESDKIRSEFVRKLFAADINDVRPVFSLYGRHQSRTHCQRNGPDRSIGSTTEN